MNDNDTSNIEEEKPVSNSKTYKEYYENGTLLSETAWVRGEPTVTINYDENGQLI